jgi:hypothetical protein
MRMLNLNELMDSELLIEQSYFAPWSIEVDKGMKWRKRRK